jgi:hypothetical protein
LGIATFRLRIKIFIVSNARALAGPLLLFWAAGPDDERSLEGFADLPTLRARYALKPNGRQDVRNWRTNGFDYC